MNNQILITKGKFDRELFEKVLPNAIKANTKIIEGSGATSALSLARSYYIQDNNVLLIIDSDSNNTHRIREKQSFAEEAINMFPSNSTMKVVVFSPELDSLLFSDKEFIEKYFSKAISQNEFELYKRDPQFAFEKLSNGQPANKVRDELLRSIDEKLIDKINTDPKIKEIVEYLGTHKA